MKIDQWCCDGPECSKTTEANTSTWWHIIEYKGYKSETELHFCSDKCKKNHTFERYGIATESNGEHVGGYRTLFGLLK